MIAASAGSLRFALDVPSTTEPRRYRVRPIAGSEADAVAALMRHAPGVDRRKPPAVSPQSRATRLGVFDDMRVLRAFIDLIGGMPTADACFIDLVVVDPRYRRGGLGAALIAALAERLPTLGATRIALEVDEANRQAHRFWQRHGFTETGRTNTRIAMERVLTPAPACGGGGSER